MDHTLSLPLQLTTLLVGGLLLFFGRRLYWLAVGALGFWLGLGFTTDLLRPESPWATVVLGAVIGLAAAVLAVFAQKVAIGLAGLALGAAAAVWLVGRAGLEGPPWAWVTTIALAALGFLLSWWLFDTALIALSALVGAASIVAPFELGPAEPWLVVVLFTAGAFAQARAKSGRRDD